MKAHDNEEIQMEVVHYLKEEKQRNNIDKFYRDKIEQPLMGIAKGPYLEVQGFFIKDKRISLQYFIGASPQATAITKTINNNVCKIASCY